MSKDWYELQEYVNDDIGWVNWREDGLAYSCVGDALADYFETNEVDALAENARVIACRVVVKGG